MINSFTLSDDQLIELLNAFDKWFQVAEERQSYLDNKKLETELQNTFLNNGYLKKVSDDEVVQEIKIYINKLEGPVGIRLGIPRITGGLDKLKSNFEYLINSDEDPFEKADSILAGERKIPIFARAFWSPIFQARYPDLLPNWNKKTEAFLRKVGVNITTGKLSVKNKYRIISDAFKYLQNLKEGYDFHALNLLMHYGTEVDEGKNLLVKMLGLKKLAEPFSTIFTSRENAEKAFDLLFSTLNCLGVDSPDDERFALTLVHQGNVLRLNFGSLAILQFYSNNHSPYQIGLVLVDRDTNFTDNFNKWEPFAQLEPSISVYELPLGVVKLEDQNLHENNERALRIISKQFQNWKASNIRRFHQDEIAQAVFDLPKREKLFSEGLSKPHDIEKGSSVWWVNQGATLEVEQKGGFMWAPLKSKSGKTFYHWANLNEIKEGDTILHYAKGSLRYVSRALGSASMEQKPDSISNQEWDNVGRLVKCEYHELTPPIQLSKFNDQIRDLNIEQGPINKAGSVNQGYLYNFNNEGLKIIQESQLETNWPNFTKVNDIHLPRDLNPHYPVEELSNDTGFEILTVEAWIRAIDRKGQAIFYGSPGTGKTYIAEKLSKNLIGGGDGFSDLVQFHPSYSYEDFIQGIRPISKPDGSLSYPVVPGRFLEFCEKAEKRSGICVLVLDEINRANLSRVFGELMYLLEYRDREVSLASGGTLKIPKNVRIIGTMNTADRSIALVDHALRRRFAFLSLSPNYNILRKYHADNNFNPEHLITILKQLNSQIGDPHYEIGISFFLRNDLVEQIDDIWRMEIEPYLEEYFFDQPERVNEFRWDKIQYKIQQ